MRHMNGGLDLTLEVIKLSSAGALILAGIVAIVSHTIGLAV